MSSNAQGISYVEDHIRPVLCSAVKDCQSEACCTHVVIAHRPSIPLIGQVKSPFRGFEPGFGHEPDERYSYVNQQVHWPVLYRTVGGLLVFLLTGDHSMHGYITISAMSVELGL